VAVTVSFSFPVWLSTLLHAKAEQMSRPTGGPELFVPSINFSMVCSGIYRSGYPTKKNFSFLKALHLQSICYLCPEQYAETNQKFCEQNNIAVLRFPMEGNKEPFVDIPEDILHRTLSALCDTRNHPVLIHCNKGKHRTGAVVACLRKLQGWSLASIFDEYIRFAGDKARVGDQQYVELYRPIVILREPFIAPWIELRSREFLSVADEAELAAAAVAQAETSLLAPEPLKDKEKKKKKTKETEGAVAAEPQSSVAT
jgi:tyrosine-protein phosphatase SIW14